jgi:hypothetical protein
VDSTGQAELTEKNVNHENTCLCVAASADLGEKEIEVLMVFYDLNGFNDFCDSHIQRVRRDNTGFPPLSQ